MTTSRETDWIAVRLTQERGCLVSLQRQIGDTRLTSSERAGLDADIVVRHRSISDLEDRQGLEADKSKRLYDAIGKIIDGVDLGH